MKKAIISVVVIAALALIGYVAAGPFLAMKGIAEGIAKKDSEKLSSHVDFPLLRQNLKEQMNAAMMKNMKDDLKENPFSGLAMAFMPKLIDTMVDGYVTPSGLAAMMSGEKPDIDNPMEHGKKEQEESAKPEKPKDVAKMFEDAKIGFDSLSQFSIAVKSKENDDEVKMVLTRDALEWKLSNILIPID